MEIFIQKMVQVCEVHLKGEMVEYLVNSLVHEITTTNPHIVSLNALEITLRKKGISITSYFMEKIFKCKYEHKK